MGLIGIEYTEIQNSRGINAGLIRVECIKRHIQILTDMGLI